VLHGRSHCLPHVHFANFNCPSRALYTAGQFACHVLNGGSLYLPCLLGQFTLMYMSNCMLCALWQVTLPIVGTLSCHIACLCIMAGHMVYSTSTGLMKCLVHCGMGSECLPCALCTVCSLEVPIACHVLKGRSDCLPRALVYRSHCRLFIMAGHTHLI
jgi:hypothetical protein